ncbi:hypothetical protein [Spirochaeta cellobiosiphila]|uniref:hypothetical protein n=1 Tax=Spirochaeta cellobiosiphila TaxID=504483 RepID=UPI000413E4C6|nr:hypothetical protein [Spirochaeta cellobiosiphila]
MNIRLRGEGLLEKLFQQALFKKEYKSIDSVINVSKMINEEEYQPIKLIDEAEEDNIKGYLKTNKENKASWLDRVRELLYMDDIVNVSNSLIFCQSF